LARLVFLPRAELAELAEKILKNPRPQDKNSLNPRDLREINFVLLVRYAFSQKV